MTAAEDQIKELTSCIDYAIRQGSSAVKPNKENGSGITNYDIELITPYANSLGISPYIKKFNDDEFLSIDKLLPKKVEPKDEVPEDERIYVTTNDYDLLRFCRGNWLCRLLYRFNKK